MTRTYLLWTALFALAALAGLVAAWWGRARFVRGRRALLAVGAFLIVGMAGGYFVHGPVADMLAARKLAEATRRTADMFRTDGLLRALAQAEPEQAAALRGRLTLALAHADDAEMGPVQARIRQEALRAALVSAMGRLPNASDDAAARLAQALLEALKSLQADDPLLCLGLVHPGSGTDALTDNALSRLDPGVRKDLEAAIALTLASSVIRPSAAPQPTKTDAALSDMFAENLSAFQQDYGGPKQVAALFEALADPGRARTVPPETLCAFAQDLLQALLRMPPEQRGPGLRRILGPG